MNCLELEVEMIDTEIETRGINDVFHFFYILLSCFEFVCGLFFLFVNLKKKSKIKIRKKL